MEVGGEVKLVGLVVVHVAEKFRAAFDYDVASSAGAVASAGVLDVKADVDTYVKEGFGLSMVMIGKGFQIELERFIGRENSYFGHATEYSAI